MRMFIHCMIALVLALPAAAPAEDEVYLRLSLITGGVQVSGKDLEDWTEASINMPLAEGDRVWAPGGGRAELQLAGGFSIRVDELTALDVLSLESGSIQFYQDQGHAYVNNLRGGIKAVQIDTPLVSVRSYDNSILMLDVAEDGKTEVSVLKGYAYAESRAGATRVSAGNTLTIAGDGSADLSPLGPADEWEKWNIERDQRLLAWGESARYLPDDLHEYASDLDAHGQWVYVSEYGYVWTPAVTVVDWAPYTVGRWGWFRSNYVWISFEPWGWVPYHYGRWAFVARFGWCWVPPLPGAVYWGPGWVGWIITPAYFAWVPLAPGEIYYGYGSYGPGSVNIINVNINTIVIKKDYRNVHARNSVTVIHRDDFEKGRWRPRKIKEERENPFLERRHEREEPVPPRVRPEKQFVFPAPARPRETRPPKERPEREETVRKEKRERRVPSPPSEITGPERKQPPERVRKIKPEELKTQRKMVKEKESSAFKQERPSDLSVRKSPEPRVIIRKPVPREAPQTQQKPQKQLKQKPQKQESEKGKRGRD